MTHPDVGYSEAEGLMLVAEEAVEIRVLRRQGRSIREIARTLEVSRNTVRRYLRSNRLPRYEREARPSKLDSFKQYIDERVKAAMEFLCDEWLVDVATDYVGKATIVAAALTLIERSLLPDRPCFFVTAGRRGGGKTTTPRCIRSPTTVEQQWPST